LGVEVFYGDEAGAVVLEHFIVGVAGATWKGVLSVGRENRKDRLEWTRLDCQDGGRKEGREATYRHSHTTSRTSA
jgi:hypothetical protein